MFTFKAMFNMVPYFCDINLVLINTRQLAYVEVIVKMSVQLYREASLVLNIYLSRGMFRNQFTFQTIQTDPLIFKDSEVYK